jgi:regulator of RNase E activity RraA
MAALAARNAGVSAFVVDGAVRDVDEYAEVGFPAWSRSLTPRTGKYRIEAVSINAPVCCGGEQVRPGDLVLADPNGVCFVPPELAAEVAARILEVAAREVAELRAAPPAAG